jgi:hypothetical protein
MRTIEEVKADLLLAKSDIRQLEQELERMESEKNGLLVWELLVDGGDLDIIFMGVRVGHINSTGFLHIYTYESTLKLYTKYSQNIKCSYYHTHWKSNGGNSGKYEIDGGILRRADISCGSIYDFNCMIPCFGCDDSNIQKFDFCKTPIVN